MRGFSPTFRLRAVLIAFVPCAVISTLASGIFAHVQDDEIQERYMLTYKAEVQRLADLSAAPLEKGDRHILKSLCTSVLKNKDIGLVGILNENGGIAASSKSENENKESQRFQASINRLKVDEKGFIKEEPIGLAVIEASKKQISIERNNLAVLCTSFILVSYVFGLLLALFISKNLTVPFRRISNTVAKIASGKLESRVSIMGDESIRGLAEGINSMAESIEHAQHNLLSKIESATEEIRRERDEAREVTLAKSRFVVAASHDLRQPMQALKLLSVELERRLLGEEELKIVAHMINSLSMVDQLIESFLDMSRLDAGVVKKNSSVFSVESIFNRMKQDFYRISTSEGVEIRFCSSKEEVFTDQMLFERILRNLISNAIKYTRTSVLVGARKRGEYTVFEVRDNGAGIEESDIKKIFGDFVQLNNPERAHNKGLGMGLSIVKRLSNLLNIEVGVKSDKDKGSIFFVKVPRNLKKPQEQDEKNKEKGIHENGDIKIATISEFESDFDICNDILKSFGCNRRHFKRSRDDKIDDVLEFRPDFVLIHGENDIYSSISSDSIGRIIKTLPYSCVVLSGNKSLPDQKDPEWDSVIYIGNNIRASKIRSIIQRRSSKKQNEPSHS